MYDDRCQVCGTRLDLLGRGYSEAAHIRGLGAPHDGEDAVENMLCLCPNCHTRFDGFALAIDEELFIHEVTAAGEGPAVGKLTVAADHKIDVRHLDYHRRFLARS
ncbi:hypothetical protein BJP25_01510 [Actinokineospora bangkokensis]|uniref:HNH nuclease domain-containing protein n=1 Tax=Actinokineospora bangkokensis TaxID=1193682 RepID=A0A1Q9LDY5_9PSEU|nr:hypothetical protein BJP25_01510 [Actinokineospora bangkokensis]